MAEDFNEIAEIVKNRDLEQFVGIRENEFFEAKGKNPYDLDNESGRFELAKDASAFANGKGGYIIIGLDHDHAPDEKTDIIKKLELLEREHFSINKYKGVLKEYIYPEIDGLEVNFVVDNKENGLGIGCIFIPAQKEEKKYFFIKKIWKNEKIQEIVFGISRRLGSSCDPLDATQLHHQMRFGMSAIAERLSNIEYLLETVISKNKQTEERESEQKNEHLKLLSKRIREIEEEN
ncbi:MAG: putative DNA binding domain-containing protein [Planctomycetes bacterium]|nr:putative DNA binding domain-containing protein [Planctomycetota bacterium]